VPFARIFAPTAVLLLALTGCGGTGPALAPREVVTRVPPEPAPPEAPGPAGPQPATTRPGAGTGLDRFVAAVQARLPDVALDRRDEEVEELGRQACTALAAGKKTASVAGELRNLGVGEADARELVALAKGTACRT
jgi:hypothetical protein